MKIRNGKKSIDQIHIVGLYFLFQDDQIVYVGQSTDVMGRLGTHLKSQDMVFDAYSYIEVSASRLRRSESRIIRLLQPKYNKVHNSAYRFVGKPFAGMKIKELLAYYQSTLQDNPIRLELLAANYQIDQWQIGWWSPMNADNVTEFNVVWLKPGKALGDRDAAFREGMQYIDTAVQVLRNIHPVVRRLVKERRTVSDISNQLRIRDSIIIPFIKTVILPEIEWWKTVQVKKAA